MGWGLPSFPGMFIAPVSKGSFVVHLMIQIGSVLSLGAGDMRGCGVDPLSELTIGEEEDGVWISTSVLSPSRSISCPASLEIVILDRFGDGRALGGAGIMACLPIHPCLKLAGDYQEVVFSYRDS